MGNFFDNIETRVTRSSFGTQLGKEITRKDLIEVKDRSYLHEALTESSKYRDLSKSVEASKLENLKNQRAYEIALSEGYSELKESLFKDVMRHICLESMLVDRENVLDNLNSIVMLVDEQVDNVGGFKGLKSLSESTQNPVLDSLVSICENMAKQVGDRNLKEANGDSKALSFDMTSEEAAEFDYKKQDFGVDSIVDVVKEKVCKVVQDEQKANQEKTAIMDEIQGKLEDVKAPVQEALQAVFENKGVEEVSLFESIMMSSYKSIMETSTSAIFESTAIVEGDECDEEEYNMDEIELGDDFDDEDMDDEYDDIEDSFLEESVKFDLTFLGAMYDVRRIPKALKDYMGDYEETMSKLIDVATSKMDIAQLRVDNTKARYFLGRFITKSIHNLQGKEEDYDSILNRIDDKIDKKAKELGVDGKFTKPNVRRGVKESLLPDKNIEKIFMQHGQNILEAFESNNEYEITEALDKMADSIEEASKKCRTRTEASKCRESVRQVQKSTEEIEEACKVKEAGCKKEEFIVCPICQEDPCICDDEEFLTEGSIVDGFKSVVNKMTQSLSKFKKTDEEKHQKSIAKHNKSLMIARRDTVIYVEDAKTVTELERIRLIVNDNIKKLNNMLKENPDNSNVIEEQIAWYKEEFTQAFKEKKEHLRKLELAQGGASNIAVNNIRLAESDYFDDGGIITEGSLMVKINQFCQKKLSKKLTKEDFDKVRERIVSIIDKCDTVDQVEYLEMDFKQAKIQLNQAVKDYPENAEGVKGQLKWLNGEGKKLLNDKKKELSTKVTESFSNRLDEVCDNLSTIIEAHESALQEAKHSIIVDHNGNDIVAPLIETADCNKTNLEFAYKVKVVCETFKDMVYKIESEADGKQLHHMISKNIESINETQDIIMNEDSLNYKFKLLESARGYLNKVGNKAVEVSENYMTDGEEVVTEALNIVDSIYSNIKRDKVLESNDPTMEVVLAEAVTKYTILEAFNTMNLIKLDKDSVRQMSRKNIK